MESLPIIFLYELIDDMEYIPKSYKYPEFDLRFYFLNYIYIFIGKKIRREIKC